MLLLVFAHVSTCHDSFAPLTPCHFFRFVKVGLAHPPAGLSRPQAATFAAVAGALGPAKSLGVGTLLTQAAADAGISQVQVNSARA